MSNVGAVAGVPNVVSQPRQEVLGRQATNGQKVSSPMNDSSQDRPMDSTFPSSEVHQLARSFSHELERSRSRRSVQTGGRRPPIAEEKEVDLGNPFTASGGLIDPTSPDFNARAWAKAMIKLHSSDNDRAPGRTAGVSFRDLGAYGRGADADYQRTLLNAFYGIAGDIRDKVLGRKLSRVDILQGFDGLVRSGEMLVVLGPPGSGCTTFLKTISGETDGFKLTPESYLNYQGISAKNMHSQFRGEAIYTAEVSGRTLPMMTVESCLFFAASCRAPRKSPGGVSRHVYAEHMAKMMMAVYGISHTNNTQVGNDFIRGVSGGERKRVTIAEASLSQAPLQCWDNSTRGLDSANAVEFCKTLRMSSELSGASSLVAIYQAPQSAYDIFDKVTVLYKGRQIYFGKTTTAKQYFLDMGFECPERQTVADFLTSITSEKERIPKQGWEDRVPRTPDDFVMYWKNSDEYCILRAEIDAFEEEFPIGGPQYEAFKASRKAQQAKGQRVKSPYTLTYFQQIRLCMWRGWQRLIGNPEITLTQLFGNLIMGLIISSVFYNLPNTSGSFRQRGSLLFFAILLAGFASALEILTLFAQRPIVEKHTRYAFYHPSAEAFASMAVDMPYKITNSILFSLVIYFMSNLRREPGPFFFFLLISFALTMTMSMVFRTIGSSARSLSQALAPSAVLMLALVIFTGFVIPTRNMLGWSRWIGFVDPISYGFEALMVNEFSGQEYACSAFIPPYPDATGNTRVCATVGAQPGSSTVNGDTYLAESFEYYSRNRWRDFGIIIAFAVFFMFTHLISTEYISEKKSKGEILVFQRGHSIKGLLNKKHNGDVEKGKQEAVHEKSTEKSAVRRNGSDSGSNGSASDDAVMIPKQTAVFQWEDVCYDIKIKKEERRILDNVDGWVKPGTLTALMGVSGAGKTTLLDVLATRVTMGVVTGKMLVDGQQRDSSFQRKTGYCQQQDLHLSTSTVREALTFSALLRQPRATPKEDKLAYVDEVIKLLDMEEYADAVVGVPGTGLNVEQRKRLTIGVELAAKPALLLFLDEPTSGLDSQTSWAILELLEKLKRHGQAILCTIHQPSAMLFQRFDRLLFLAKGGRTVYYGEVGDSSHILTEYFERNGAHPCPENANPAEWMLEVIGAAPGSHTDIDWPQTWLDSPERVAVKNELRRLESHKNDKAEQSSADDSNHKDAQREFAAAFNTQLWEVLKRVGQQYYRTPSYLFSKLALVIAAAAFIGFVFFRASKSLQSLQNQMFSIFMLLVVFPSLCQQLMPLFVTQREMYEARERPAKTYSWQAFMLSNIMIEIPWQMLAGLFLFVLWYYPIGLYRNAEPTGTVNERGILTFILMEEFMIFTSTFAHMVVAGIPSAETAGNIASLLFSLCLIFCGSFRHFRHAEQVSVLIISVLATADTLGWWIFMNRVSPFTYLVEAVLVTAIAGTNVVCEPVELLKFEPVAGQTCRQYMAPYISAAGGYLADENATSNCQFCPIASTDVFLSSVQYSYSHRWRNVGLLLIYIAFNIFGALGIYYLARVPKKAKKEKEE